MNARHYDLDPGTERTLKNRLEEAALGSERPLTAQEIDELLGLVPNSDIA